MNSSLSERLGRAEAGRPDRLTEVSGRIQNRLIDVLGPQLYDSTASETDLLNLVNRHVNELLSEERSPLSLKEKAEVTQQITDSVIGLGPLEIFMRDPQVSEIMVNGAEEIYVEREGRLFLTGATFHDDDQLIRTIDKIAGRVGRRIDEASPYVDARLPNGSRVNAIIPPLALDGPALTIRKFSAEPLVVEDLVSAGTMTRAVAELLEKCVEGRLNILVSGGTGAGKTTTLNVLSSFIPADERILTIEDAAELRLQQPHVVRLESRPPNIEGKGSVSIRDLVRNALRMRPNRIVVGEVRGPEALDMLQAMNTGHDGSISTLHANSPRDALARLETMGMMAGVDFTVRAVRDQIYSAVDLLIHQARLRDGTRRITHITEVTGREGDVIQLQDIFLFDFKAGTDRDGRFMGKLQPTGLRPTFMEKLAEHGLELSPKVFMRDVK